MTAIMLPADRMDLTLDARGLACPLPAIKARLALAELPAEATLVVLATDPEAPIDVAAVAADERCSFSAERTADGWTMTLRRGGPFPAHPRSGRPGV
jgi:tRNA 2-thiouridine synthesizing protein A